MMKVEVKIPGKLYIAGEYAVVESGHTAILTAVDRYITLKLEDSSKNELKIPHYKEKVTWPLGGELNPEGEHWAFTAEAINTATAYFKARNIPLTPIKMTIETELIDDSGAKYGLGSSAAATTAVITALMAKFAPETDLLTKFKLAALSHLVVQGNGSCGDIACCMYGGLIAYTTFDQEWIKYHLPYKSLAWFIANPWPQLKIERISEPDLPFLIGWTGNPVSTGQLVSDIQIFKQKNPDAYTHFLNGSTVAVQKLLQGLKTQNHTLIFEAVKENRALLQELGQNAGVQIETELLAGLAETAEELSGAGKSSGSGGGDCGIAFLPNETAAESVKKAWQAKGILPLPFAIGQVIVKK
ncbi:phosphomevalonate kinase [Listeria floridensis FSL S10-1187]|uniref:phosphomevalonate kinase n=1 Tax=Listeria floridensis FSL S10-1187 TaxID=1265817 RepID=A0ABN0REI8_9LIST|nr:phosphomevalonate kinase [Listeria floridensis]EUJ31018.1 phosphomevalonate kinase [Listeria floridensis FSL S10-1187]